MVDLQVAKELRMLGLSYKQISEQLGCSVDWCKRSLNGVPKNMNEQEAIKALVQAAKSKAGVTNYEIVSKIREVEPNSFSKEDKEKELKLLTKYKSKIKKEHGTLIRPFWAIPGKAKAIHQRILESAHSLTERLEEEVAYIREDLEIEGKYAGSIRAEINRLTAEGSKQIRQGIEDYCSSLLDAVNEVERRNPPIRKPSMKREFDNAYGIPEVEVPY